MEIEQLRDAIDVVDNRLLELLTERQALASKLGEIKRSRGMPIYDPVRENEILGRLNGLNAGKLSEKAVLAAWREIFSASRQAQTPVRVAYLGPEGTFTQQAALARFGSSSELIATQTIAAAFGWVANHTVDHAVLPVENTLQGIVGETVDLLGAHRRPLIIGEIAIPINFVFSTVRDRLEDIRTIYSKREAFPQCSNFLNQPALEKAERRAVASTAEAVWKAVEDPDGAALSAEIAASQAGLPILFRHVENNVRNQTRFLVLGHDQPAPTAGDKTSVFARVPNVSGGLERLLTSFKNVGVNLTKIESRPMDDAANFETWFYIEFEGNIRDLDGGEFPGREELVWLGSYPRREQMP
jgi:chorismate mutase/prephenate dehydratase